MFCRPATEKQLQHFKSIGWNNARFSPNQPLGPNTIRELIKEGAERLGVENWRSFRPHELRGAFLSRLANDDGVNTNETLAAGMCCLYHFFIYH